MSQVDTNPFAFSDTNKRYHTYDYYLKHRFGGKCAKIPLDAGLSCPNIDGTCGYGGCIYCSGGSSWGQARDILPLEKQYKKGIEIMQGKWKTNSFIPYLQAYTNTHTSPDNLEKILDRVSKFEGAVMLDIATRADCLEDEKIEILNRISERIPITVELGLQTANDETAKKINRCHTYDVFCDAFNRLRRGAPNVKIGIHIINGLPNESVDDMKNTVTCVANLHPDLVKIHLLHVLKHTPLANMYKSGKYEPLARDEYIKIVCDQLELLPPDTVIERVTGDGLESELLAPLWSKKKVTIINDIDKELLLRGSYQGKYYKIN
ncbi:MAG: TIGR01212 family radical SAM protein [Clostridia bacterium]|nr:TIGR01212 family radical SAM protein [Clostridia bacterium]